MKNLNNHHLNQVLFMSQGHILAKCIMLATEKQLDQMLLNNDKKTINEMAEKLKFHPSAAQLFLRVLDAYDIVAINSDGTVTATDLTAYLPYVLSPQTCKGLLYFEKLELSLQSNQECYSKAFGKTFFEDIVADAKEYEKFIKSAQETEEAWLPCVFDIYDFLACKSVVDVGGGGAYFLVELLKKYHDHKAIYCGQEANAKAAKELLESQMLKHRVEVINESAGEEIPVGADYYLICRTLITWSDEEACDRIRAVIHVMNQNSRLLIIDFVAPEKGHSFYQRTSIYNLSLLALIGCQIRSETMLRNLIAKTPSKILNFNTTDESHQPESLLPLCVIECAKINA